MKIERLNEIKHLLDSIPPTPWEFRPGDDFDHWEIWSSHPNGYHMVQDDGGVPPDESFINFVLQSRDIIEELLREIVNEN